MDPILVGLASSMAWALVKGGAGAAKAYVLGGPEEERALYGVLEPALVGAIGEAATGTDAATAERMEYALGRWFYDPDVQAEVLASAVEVRDPNVGLLRDRFGAVGDEEGLPLDLEVFARSFQRRASRNLDEETKKKGSVLANMVMGGSDVREV